ncbi:MAG: lysylphosphatidylglycerol synthase domain-containing protein, partial [Acidimicrobiia bacterium]
ACVIRWFHASVTYRELLPVRAASYVIAFFNVNVGRGALAAYLSRRLGIPFLQIGSTVLFLLLTEYTHLVVWGIVGLLLFQSPAAEQLWWGPLGVAALWLMMVVARSVMGGWSLLRTFRMAPPLRYLQVVLLRVPMFAVSLCLHFFAARTFGLEIPFPQMLTFLPLIFMIAALPITVAHLGSTQAAWLFFFSAYAPPPKLLAFSLAAHLTFMATRALLGIAFLPRAYSELVEGRKTASLLAQRA